MRNAKAHHKELRAWMKRTKTNQSALAQITGLSKTSICFVMRGDRHFSADVAGRLADLTEIPVEKLLTGRTATRFVKLLGKRLNTTSRKVNDNANVV